MTVWDFLTNMFNWFEARTTRMLGIAGGTLAILATSNVVPENQMKYYMAAIAVLTYWRGQSTSAVVSEAKSIINQVKNAPTIVPTLSPKQRETTDG
jgi:hypothetical protein